MKKILVVSISVIFCVIGAYAQTVEWAGKVVSYSSQRAEKQFAAKQALGEPSIFPNGGDRPSAWSPSRTENKKPEFIKVRFKNPMFIKKVAVAETYNPGSISKIYVYNTNEDEYLIFENEKPGGINQKVRLLEVNLPEITKYKVRAVKVELNTKSVKGYNCIDAIAISDSDDPIKIEVDEASKITFQSQPENLGEHVNSPYHDYIPQISPDGKTLYFTRLGHPENEGADKAQDIWFSELKNNNWTTAQRMPAPLNDKHPNFVSTITPDGNTLLLGMKYSDDGTPETGVSFSYKTRKGWSYPKPAVIQNFFTNSPYVEYCLSANKKVMLMTLDRSDGLGDNDIYVSFLQKDKTWSNPKNLGKTINTADVEMSPFLAADGETMYFASAGHRGYGKEDIFMSKRLDNTWTKWSKPKNLGELINSDERDGYYSIPASGEYAYFVSKKQTIGKSDIFRIKLPDEIKPSPVALVYGRVLHAKTKEPLDSRLIYESVPEGLEMGEANSKPETGEYKIVLPIGAAYNIFADKEGFISTNEDVDLTEVEKHYVEIKKDIYLNPLEEGFTFNLKNVRFERSKFELLDSSFPELNRLVNVMNANPNMEILLEGHTDNTGSQNLNLELSEQRVEQVQKYLVSKGIKKSRIQLKGYGGLKPIADNGREATRKLNRRVDLKIIAF